MRLGDYVGFTITYVSESIGLRCLYCGRRLEKNHLKFSEKSSWRDRKIFIEILCFCHQIGELELDFPTLSPLEIVGRFEISPYLSVRPIEYNQILEEAQSILAKTR